MSSWPLVEPLIPCDNFTLLLSVYHSDSIWVNDCASRSVCAGGGGWGGEVWG